MKAKDARVKKLLLLNAMAPLMRESPYLNIYGRISRPVVKAGEKGVY